MSAGPTITHAQAAKLREVFKGEQGWAIVANKVENVEPAMVQVMVSTVLFESSFHCWGIGDTVEKAVDNLLSGTAEVLPQLPGVPR